MKSFQAANKHEDRGTPQPASHKAIAKRWVGPEELFVKAIWDASLNTFTNSTGLGGIIRDSNGHALVTICSTISNLISPSLAEAIALRKLMLVWWEL